MMELSGMKRREEEREIWRERGKGRTKPRVVVSCRPSPCRERIDSGLERVVRTWIWECSWQVCTRTRSLLGRIESKYPRRQNFCPSGHYPCSINYSENWSLEPLGSTPWLQYIIGLMLAHTSRLGLWIPKILWHRTQGHWQQSHRSKSAEEVIQS